MAKYKKDYRVVHDPGTKENPNPYEDLRDVDWEKESASAISPEDYKKHMMKKYKLMSRNMDILKKVKKKGMASDEAEYLAREKFEYKKRSQPKGVYDFVYDAKEESKRDAQIYKTLKSAIEQEQDLKRDTIEKKSLFGKKKKKLRERVLEI